MESILMEVSNYCCLQERPDKLRHGLVSNIDQPQATSVSGPVKDHLLWGLQLVSKNPGLDLGVDSFEITLSKVERSCSERNFGYAEGVDRKRSLD